MFLPFILIHLILPIAKTLILLSPALPVPTLQWIWITLIFDIFCCTYSILKIYFTSQCDGVGWGWGTVGRSGEGKNPRSFVMSIDWKNKWNFLIFWLFYFIRYYICIFRNRLFWLFRNSAIRNSGRYQMTIFNEFIALGSGPKIPGPKIPKISLHSKTFF